MMFHKETPHGIDFVCDSERNMFNSPHFKIKCEAGLLVLFPSDLKHSVETNASEDNRMSLAFNTYISGTIGNKYLLNLLEL
jgi:ectoine hydroxylase-related dioxygenase (phytanoyl-CoA dioxygenase family)